MPHPIHAAHELAAREFQRILLIKPSSLGDVVHALPVLNGLRDRYPRAQIDWLIAAPLAPLLKHHPQLDELVEFDRRRLARMWRSPGALRDFFHLIRRLRRRRYDLVIDLQGLFRAAFFARATGSPTRLGFADAREGAPLFYTHTMPGGTGDIHAVDRNLQVFDVLGVPAPEPRFPLPLGDSVRASVTTLLSPIQPHPGQRMIAFVPGARWETKQWSPQRFAETINRLTESHSPCECILLGGGDEVALCQSIAGACRRPPLDLAGKTSLTELAGVIERVDLVVCQDSAAAHLGAALDRPLVCITGPTNPHRTGPFRRPNDVVRLELECSPCYLRRLDQCPHDHRCMDELSVDQVLEAIQNALRSIRDAEMTKAPLPEV